MLEIFIFKNFQLVIIKQCTSNVQEMSIEFTRKFELCSGIQPSAKNQNLQLRQQVLFVTQDQLLLTAF